MARRELAAVRAPTFNAVDTGAVSRQSGQAAVTLERLRAMPPEEATEALLEIVVEEIARVLRLPPKEVDRHRPLAEIGMDSLMMLELRTTVEASLQIELPMMSLASGITPADVARRVTPLVTGEATARGRAEHAGRPCRPAILADQAATGGRLGAARGRQCRDAARQVRSTGRYDASRDRTPPRRRSIGYARRSANPPPLRLGRRASPTTGGRREFDFTTLPEYEILKIWKAVGRHHQYRQPVLSPARRPRRQHDVDRRAHGRQLLLL